MKITHIFADVPQIFADLFLAIMLLFSALICGICGNQKNNH